MVYFGGHIFGLGGAGGQTVDTRSTSGVPLKLWGVAHQMCTWKDDRGL